MSTKRRDGSVAIREDLDLVRGTTACSPMVFYGLLAWANLSAAGKALKRDGYHRGC
jgi:hypothetical protein